MAADATYFAALIESLYSGLEALDVSGYSWADSDGWTQARTPFAWTAHLESWIDLGNVVRLVKPGWQHTGGLAFAVRFQPDDDSISQARMHAAIRAACEYLIAWSYSSSDGLEARILGIDGAEIEGAESGWVTVRIQFFIQLLR